MYCLITISVQQWKKKKKKEKNGKKWTFVVKMEYCRA